MFSVQLAQGQQAQTNGTGTCQRKEPLSLGVAAQIQQTAHANGFPGNLQDRLVDPNKKTHRNATTQIFQKYISNPSHTTSSQVKPHKILQQPKRDS